MRRLCAPPRKAPNLVQRPLLVGGGRCPTVNGPFVIVNRPLLDLFANASLLEGCRADLLKKPRDEYAYAGASYNNDHLIAHCAFSYFPHAAATRIMYSLYMPEFRPGRPGERPLLFHHNQDRESARDATARMRERWKLPFPNPREPLVAFHHATDEDRAWLEGVG